MVLVHDQVADGQVGEGRDRGAALVFRAAQGAPARAEDLRLGEENQAQSGDGEPARDLADHHAQALRPVQRAAGRGVDPVLAEDLEKVVRLLGVGRDQAHAEPFLAPAGQLAGQLVEPPRVATDGVGIQRQACRPRGPGHELQLHERPGAQLLAQRRPVRRALGNRFQYSRIGDHHGRGWREVREQAADLGRRDVGGLEREHQELVERRFRALRGGIEQPNGFDLVAQELEPRRGRVGRREDVHDAAPDAPLPDLYDEIDPFVAGLLQRFQQQLTVEAVAETQAQRGRFEGRRWGQRGLQRRGRGHHDQRLAGQQAAPDEGSLGVRLAATPAAPEPRLRLGELGHRGPEKAEILDPLLGFGERGCQHEGGSWMGLEELGQGQPPGGAREAGHAQTWWGLGEGLRQLFERRPLSEHAIEIWPGTESIPAISPVDPQPIVIPWRGKTRAFPARSSGRRL